MLPLKVYFLYYKGALHLSELAGQTRPVVRRILILIRTIQPDQIISKKMMYARHAVTGLMGLSKLSFFENVAIRNWISDDFDKRRISQPKTQ